MIGGAVMVGDFILTWNDPRYSFQTALALSGP